MMTKAKYEKAIDDAFADHMGTCFAVLAKTMNGAAKPETKEIAIKTYSAGVKTLIEAHETALANMPESLSKK